MVDYLYLFMYRFFSFLVMILPASLMDALLKLLSHTYYRLKTKHFDIINANLTLAFGDALTPSQRDRIGKRTIYNLLQTIVGFTRRERASKESIQKSVTFVNEQILLDALSQKKPILFITAHYGNWELIPPLLTTKFGLKLAIVGRKLDSKVMDRILVSNREVFDVSMIYRKGAIKNALKALNSDHALGLLLDQHLDAKQGGIEVTFFGHKAYQSPAASVLARATNAIIIPVFISTQEYHHYTLTFYAPLATLKTEEKEKDIQQMTQAQSDIIEKVIRNKPDEWFWVHKRWKGFYPEIYQRDNR